MQVWVKENVMTPLTNSSVWQKLYTRLFASLLGFWRVSFACGSNDDAMTQEATTT
jgi:hypothetical protein